MAKVATWDILRINRLPSVDSEAEDDDILAFMAVRIAQARLDGYKRIIVAGYSRGGWLAKRGSGRSIGLCRLPDLLTNKSVATLVHNLR